MALSESSQQRQRFSLLSITSTTAPHPRAHQKSTSIVDMSTASRARRCRKCRESRQPSWIAILHSLNNPGPPSVPALRDARDLVQGGKMRSPQDPSLPQKNNASFWRDQENGLVGIVQVLSAYYAVSGNARNICFYPGQALRRA